MPWPEVTPRVKMGPMFDTDEEEALMGEHPPLDTFSDDTELVCGVESPEVCESCQ